MGRKIFLITITLLTSVFCLSPIYASFSIQDNYDGPPLPEPVTRGKFYYTVLARQGMMNNKVDFHEVEKIFEKVKDPKKTWICEDNICVLFENFLNNSPKQKVDSVWRYSK